MPQNEGKQHTPNSNDNPRDEEMQDVRQRNDHIQGPPKCWHNELLVARTIKTTNKAATIT